MVAKRNDRRHRRRLFERICHAEPGRLGGRRRSGAELRWLRWLSRCTHLDRRRGCQQHRGQLERWHDSGRE